MKKKTLFLTILVGTVALIAVFPLTAMAAVKGVCSNCHTMHNSQGTDPMAWDENGDPLATAQSALLRSTCLGCHTTSDAEPLAVPPLGSSEYPFVMSTGDGNFTDDNCLAGGFFSPLTVGNQDDNGDNNHTLRTQKLPAGYANDEALGDWYEGDTETDGLGCAGSNGCHGVHNVVDDMEAISGGHHADSLIYRMLYVGNDMTSDGVLGTGASDYEEDLIATPDLADPHNIYSAGPQDPSISELCAICHGNFHNEFGTVDDAGSASPWLRHPTDVDIPGGWHIGNEGIALTASDFKNNPVGYDNANDAGQRRVTCLSCHRAHGTENMDLLRWGYSGDDATQTQIAGVNSGVTYGCLGCHDRQR